MLICGWLLSAPCLSLDDIWIVGITSYLVYGHYNTETWILKSAISHESFKERLFHLPSLYRWCSNNSQDNNRVLPSRTTWQGCHLACVSGLKVDIMIWRLHFFTCRLSLLGSLQVQSDVQDLKNLIDLRISTSAKAIKSEWKNTITQTWQAGYVFELDTMIFSLPHRFLTVIAGRAYREGGYYHWC